MTFVDLDSIHVPAAGTRPPAAWGLQVNANMDAINTDVLAKLGAFATWTPTLTQGVTVAKTTNWAHYLKLGRLVICHWDLSVTASGTSGTAIAIGLPVTAARVNTVGGRFSWYDASAAAFYQADVLLGSTTTLAGLVNAGPGSGAVLGINFGGAIGGVTYPTQLQSGDVLRGFAVYESAA